MQKVFFNDEAYAGLASVKRKGQGFSDVIMEKIHGRIGLKAFLGSCKGIDAERLTKEITKERNREYSI